MARVDLNIPQHIPNFIDGQERPAGGGASFGKLDPATGRELCRVSQSGPLDVTAAVSAARRAQPGWAEATPVHRGDLLRAVEIVTGITDYQYAELVSGDLKEGDELVIGVEVKP